MVEYTVVKSRRKTLCISVNKLGDVTVKAPLYTTKRQIMEFVLSHEKWIEKTRKKIINNTVPEPTPEELQKWKSAARDIIFPLVEKWSNIMQVKPASVKITTARTRFGSCSAKNAICFSARLMAYPEEAVEYVVVHELSHILYHNHSASFYNNIEKYLPDYQQRAKLLGRNK